MPLTRSSRSSVLACLLMVCGVCDSSDCSGLEAAVNGNSEACFRSPAYRGWNRCARRAAGAQRVCGEDVPCYFIDALLQRAWMQNGDAEAPLLGVRALMNRAVQLPERAALDVWAPHKHFEVACWDTSAATGGQFIPLELDSADSYPGVEKAGCRVRTWKGSDRQGA